MRRARQGVGNRRGELGQGMAQGVDLGGPVISRLGRIDVGTAARPARAGRKTDFAQALGQNQRQPDRLSHPPERHGPADQAPPRRGRPAHQREPRPHPLGEHDQPQIGADRGRDGDGADRRHERNWNIFEAGRQAALSPASTGATAFLKSRRAAMKGSNGRPRRCPPGRTRSRSYQDHPSIGPRVAVFSWLSTGVRPCGALVWNGMLRTCRAAEAPAPRADHSDVRDGWKADLPLAKMDAGRRSPRYIDGIFSLTCEGRLCGMDRWSSLMRHHSPTPSRRTRHSEFGFCAKPNSPALLPALNY